MTAYELYQATLRELDFWQAPAFEPGDFTYRFNDQRQALVDQAKQVFEETQQVTDLVRHLIKSAEYTVPAGTDLRAFPLPAAALPDSAWDKGAYQFLTRCGVTLRFTKRHGCRKPADLLAVSARRYTDDMQAFAEDSYYHRPWVGANDARVFYRVRGQKLELVLDQDTRPLDYAQVASVRIGYVCAPKPIRLASRQREDAGHVDSDWPPEIDRLVVKQCVRTFLEPAQATRLEGYTAVNSN